MESLWGAGHAPTEKQKELRRPLPGLASEDSGWSPEVLRSGGGGGSVPSGVRKVLGGHKDGAPSWPLPVGGEGDVDVKVERFHQAGASGCLLRAWGSPPSSLSAILPTPQHPTLSPGGLELYRPPGNKVG